MRYVLAAAGIFGLDAWLKQRMDQNLKPGVERPVLKGRVILRKYYNKGAALDALDRWPGVVKGVSAAVLMLLCAFGLAFGKKEKGGFRLGFSMVIGGGASNLWDRWKLGHVVDYFSFQSRFPRIRRIVFNLSDMCIFLGTLLMAVFHKK